MNARSSKRELVLITVRTYGRYTEPWHLPPPQKTKILGTPLRGGGEGRKYGCTGRITKRPYRRKRDGPGEGGGSGKSLSVQRGRCRQRPPLNKRTQINTLSTTSIAQRRTDSKSGRRNCYTVGTCCNYRKASMHL